MKRSLSVVMMTFRCRRHRERLGKSFQKRVTATPADCVVDEDAMLASSVQQLAAMEVQATRRLFALLT
jgi:hypothetical protein